MTAPSTEGRNIPALEPHCGSWVATDKPKSRIFEIFDAVVAQQAADAGWLVETTAQYLGRINSERKP